MGLVYVEWRSSRVLPFWRKNVFGMDGWDVWDAWTAGIKRIDYFGIVRFKASEDL